MPQFEENTFAVNICSDINKCLAELRLDKQINLYIHIYSQLDNNMRNDPTILEFYETCRKRYFDFKFRQELEFYYAMVDGDEGRLLFDPQISYNPKYDMRNFLPLYNEIANIQHGLAINLGVIKKKILNTQVEASGF